MDVLEKIFGSAAKVKIMRIFLFNPGVSYDLSTIMTRAKVNKTTAKKEIKTLTEICLIRQKTLSRNVIVDRRKQISKRKKVQCWALNNNFSYLGPLQSFLINTALVQNKDIINRFDRIGRIKLLIISGIFIQEWESRVDLLIVGDNIRKDTLENVVKTLESEIGKELSYAAFETSDFQYRLAVYDKLIRDILDYPHQKLINKLGIA
jgi:hypothetical protein